MTIFQTTLKTIAEEKVCGKYHCFTDSPDDAVACQASESSLYPALQDISLCFTNSLVSDNVEDYS